MQYYIKKISKKLFWCEYLWAAIQVNTLLLCPPYIAKGFVALDKNARHFSNGDNPEQVNREIEAFIKCLLKYKDFK